MSRATSGSGVSKNTLLPSADDHPRILIRQRTIVTARVAIVIGDVRVTGLRDARGRARDTRQRFAGGVVTVDLAVTSLVVESARQRRVRIEHEHRPIRARPRLDIEPAAVPATREARRLRQLRDFSDTAPVRPTAPQLEPTVSSNRKSDPFRAAVTIAPPTLGRYVNAPVFTIEVVLLRFPVFGRRGASTGHDLRRTPATHPPTHTHTIAVHLPGMFSASPTAIAPVGRRFTDVPRQLRLRDQHRALAPIRGRLTHVQLRRSARHRLRSRVGHRDARVGADKERAGPIGRDLVVQIGRLP